MNGMVRPVSHVPALIDPTELAHGADPGRRLTVLETALDHARDELRRNGQEWPRHRLVANVARLEAAIHDVQIQRDELATRPKES
jgi:hypothetical protein